MQSAHERTDLRHDVINYVINLGEARQKLRSPVEVGNAYVVVL